MIHTLRLLPPREVCGILGFSRTTLDRERDKGLIPRPVHVTERRVAYPAHEIDLIARAKCAGRTDDEVRDLVRRLHVERAALIAET